MESNNRLAMEVDQLISEIRASTTQVVKNQSTVITGSASKKTSKLKVKSEEEIVFNELWDYLLNQRQLQEITDFKALHEFFRVNKFELKDLGLTDFE
jgi:hypothetical protein